MRYEKTASFKPPRRLHIFMRRTTISHFCFLIANPRRCPPCLGKSAFHLRRRAPDEAIPPSPPQMRLREQTGWGFAGTLLKKSPRERGRKYATFDVPHKTRLLKKSPRERGRKHYNFSLVVSYAVLIEKSPQERGRKLPWTYCHASRVSRAIEKKSPRKGTKTHTCLLSTTLPMMRILKKGPRERGRKPPAVLVINDFVSGIEKRSPRKGTKTMRRGAFR